VSYPLYGFYQCPTCGGRSETVGQCNRCLLRPADYLSEWQGARHKPIWPIILFAIGLVIAALGTAAFSLWYYLYLAGGPYG
jgi:hypothetical protein